MGSVDRPIARSDACAGFTLIEAVMVITITGIIAGMVAVFIKSPIDSYIDTARRVALTDVADTAVRRIGRDVRLALPNSVRNPSGGSNQCIEFIPTKIGGRYRQAPTSTGTGNILDFSLNTNPFDDSFDMLWNTTTSPLPTGDQVAAGDIVVVYNDGYTGNAYTGSNAIKVASVAASTATGTAITLVDNVTGTPFNRKQFPSASPAYRFQVIPATSHVVAYVCSGTTLTRYARTLSTAWAQPATCAAMTAAQGGSATLSSAVLADNVDVASCSLKYEPPGSGTGSGRSGMVSIALTITQSGESIKLYHQVHIDNTP